MNRPAHDQHVTGPISTLPGATGAPYEGAVCDEHPDRPAVMRVQGETDSMGSEQLYMCQACYDAYKADRERLNGGAYLGHCGRCGGHARVHPQPRAAATGQPAALPSPDEGTASALSPGLASNASMGSASSCAWC